MKEMKCVSRCPQCNCGVDDIDWGIKRVREGRPSQTGTCQKCGCKFEEVYGYTHTEWEPKINFDRFEVEKVAEYANPKGGTFCEAVTASNENDEDAIRTFWTLYGHTPNQGVEALIDNEDEDYIRALCVYFNGLIKKAK